MALSYFAQWVVKSPLDIEVVRQCVSSWQNEASDTDQSASCAQERGEIRQEKTSDSWTLSCEQMVAMELVSFAACSWHSGAVIRVKSERPHAVLGKGERLPPAPTLVARLQDELSLRDDALVRGSKVLVSVDPDHPRASERLVASLKAHLRGMATVEGVEPARAADICLEFDLRSDGRLGTVLLGLLGEESAIRWKAFSATSALRDPEALARAIQSRLLGSVPFADNERLASALKSVGGEPDQAVMEDFARHEESLASRIEALKQELVVVTIQRDDAIDELERLEGELSDQQVQTRRLQRLAWKNNLFDVEESDEVEEDLELASVFREG